MSVLNTHSNSLGIIVFSNPKRINKDMKRSGKKLTASIVAVALAVTQFGAPLPAWGAPSLFFPSEVKASSEFQFQLPAELGTIQSQFRGNGPLLIHIQTAHGNYEAQKKIHGILRHLKEAYGIKHLFVEGSAFKLRPELLRFYPDRMDLTRDVLEELAKMAYVKGPELFLAETPEAEAYGIENLDSYVLNGKAFVEVLTQQEKTANFLQESDLQIERLTSPYLSKDLRGFLKRLEAFEANRISLVDWLGTLKAEARKRLEIDLAHPVQQIDWPMLVRIYKLQEFESRIDFQAFERERKKFLSVIAPQGQSRNDVEQIRLLLTTPLSQHALPEPETTQLFERMISQLPENFNYKAFPNVCLFIGHLILQSELKAERLIEETETLSDQIQKKLAEEGEAEKVLGLLRDHRLLKRLFALELTPRDYEKVVERGEDLRPDRITKRFLELNREKRVKNLKFNHTKEIQTLFEKALEFYAGAKERDRSLTENLVKKMEELGAAKAVVVTGGFHAEPFKKFFQERSFNYALVSPRMTTVDGREAYLASIFNTRLDPKEVASATRETAPFVATGRSELLRMGVDGRKVAQVVVEGNRKVLFEKGIARSPIDFAVEYNRTPYAREFGLLDLARQLTSERTLPKADTLLRLSDGTAVSSGFLTPAARSETRMLPPKDEDWWAARARLSGADVSQPVEKQVPAPQRHLHKKETPKPPPSWWDVRATLFQAPPPDRRAEVHQDPTDPGTPQSSPRSEARAETRSGEGEPRLSRALVVEEPKFYLRQGEPRRLTIFGEDRPLEIRLNDFRRNDWAPHQVQAVVLLIGPKTPIRITRKGAPEWASPKGLGLVIDKGESVILSDPNSGKEFRLTANDFELNGFQTEPYKVGERRSGGAVAISLTPHPLPSGVIETVAVDTASPAEGYRTTLGEMLIAVKDHFGSSGFTTKQLKVLGFKSAPASIARAYGQDYIDRRETTSTGRAAFLYQLTEKGEGFVATQRKLKPSKERKEESLNAILSAVAQKLDKNRFTTNELKAIGFEEPRPAVLRAMKLGYVRRAGFNWRNHIFKLTPKGLQFLASKGVQVPQTSPKSGAQPVRRELPKTKLLQLKVGKGEPLGQDREGRKWTTYALTEARWTQKALVTLFRAARLRRFAELFSQKGRPRSFDRPILLALADKKTTNKEQIVALVLRDSNSEYQIIDFQTYQNVPYAIYAHLDAQRHSRGISHRGFKNTVLFPAEVKIQDSTSQRHPDTLDAIIEPRRSEVRIQFVYDRDIGQEVRKYLEDHVKGNPLYATATSVEVATVQGDRRRFRITSKAGVSTFEVSGITNRAPPETYLREIDQEFQTTEPLTRVSTLTQAVSRHRKSLLWITTLSVIGIAAFILIEPLYREHRAESAYQEFVRYSQEIQIAAGPLLPSVAELGADHHSIQWEGRRVEAIAGAHGAPQGIQAIVRLSQEVIRNPKEWLIFAEGANASETLAKSFGAASQTPQPDVDLVKKLAKDHDIPIEDIVPLDGDPDVLKLLEERLKMDRDELLAATIYPRLYDFMSVLPKLMIMKGNFRDLPFASVFDAYLKMAVHLHKIPEEEIRRIVLNKNAEISASSEAFSRFYSTLWLVREELFKARNEVGQKRAREVLAKYLKRRNVLMLIGGTHTPIVGIPMKQYKDVSLIPAKERIVWLVDLLKENTHSIRAKRSEVRSVIEEYMPISERLTFRAWRTTRRDWGQVEKALQRFNPKAQRTLRGQLKTLVNFLVEHKVNAFRFLRLTLPRFLKDAESVRLLYEDVEKALSLTYKTLSQQGSSGLTLDPSEVLWQTEPAVSVLEALRRVGGRGEIEEKMIEIIVKQFNVKSYDVAPEAPFEDFGADSLGQVELVMALEDEFDLSVSDQDAEKIRTVQQAIDYISEHRSGAPRSEVRMGKDEAQSWIATLKRAHAKLGELEGAASALAYQSKSYQEDPELTTDAVLALLAVIERHREPEAAGVREDALWALEEIGSVVKKIAPTVTEALFKMALSDSSPHVRAKSWNVLVKYYAEDVERILKAGDQTIYTPEDQKALLITYRNLEPDDPKRQQIFDALLVQNKNLPVAIAGQEAKQEQDKFDYAQEGIMGLRKAIKRFDFSRGQDFPAYAGTVIRRTIQRYRAAARKGMAIPQYELARLHEVNEAVDRWKHEYHREPMRQEWDEIVLQLGLDKEIEKAVERWRKDHSQDPSAEEMERIEAEAALSPSIENFHKMIRRTLQAATLRYISDEESLLDESVPQTTFLEPAESLEELPAEREQEAMARFREVIQKLDPKSILILKLRSGVGTKDKKAYMLKEIATILGVERQRVHQIETKAKERAQKTSLDEEKGSKEIPTGILDHTDVYLFEEYGIVADREILSLKRKLIERRVRTLLDKGVTLQQLREKPRLLLGENVQKIVGRKSGSVLVPVDESGRFKLNGETYNLGPEFAGKIVIATYDEPTGKFVVTTEVEKPKSSESAPPVVRSETREARGLDVTRRDVLKAGALGVLTAAAQALLPLEEAEAQEAKEAVFADLVRLAQEEAQKPFVRQVKTDVPVLDALDYAQASQIRGAKIFDVSGRAAIAGPRREKDWRKLRIFTVEGKGKYREFVFDRKLVDYSRAGLAEVSKEGQSWTDVSLFAPVPGNDRNVPQFGNVDGNGYELWISEDTLFGASFRPFLHQEVLSMKPSQAGEKEKFPELTRIFVQKPASGKQIVYEFIENEDAIMVRVLEAEMKRGETLIKTEGLLIPRKGHTITAEMNLGLGASSMYQGPKQRDSNTVKVTYKNGQVETYPNPPPGAGNLFKDFTHPKHGEPIAWSLENRREAADTELRRKASYFVSNLQFTAGGRSVPTRTELITLATTDPNDDNVVVRTTLKPEKPMDRPVSFSYTLRVAAATEAPVARREEKKEEKKEAGPVQKEEVKLAGEPGAVRQANISADKLKEVREEGGFGFVYEKGGGEYGGAYVDLEVVNEVKGRKLVWDWTKVEEKNLPAAIKATVEVDGKAVGAPFLLDPQKKGELVLPAELTSKKFRLVFIYEAYKHEFKPAAILAKAFSASRSEVRSAEAPHSVQIPLEAFEEALLSAFFSQLVQQSEKIASVLGLDERKVEAADDSIRIDFRNPVEIVEGSEKKTVEVGAVVSISKVEIKVQKEKEEEPKTEPAIKITEVFFHKGGAHETDEATFAPGLVTLNTHGEEALLEVPILYRRPIEAIRFERVKRDLGEKAIFALLNYDTLEKLKPAKWLLTQVEFKQSPGRSEVHSAPTGLSTPQSLKRSASRAEVREENGTAKVGSGEQVQVEVERLVDSESPEMTTVTVRFIWMAVTGAVGEKAEEKKEEKRTFKETSLQESSLLEVLKRYYPKLDDLLKERGRSAQALADLIAALVANLEQKPGEKVNFTNHPEALDYLPGFVEGKLSADDVRDRLSGEFATTRQEKESPKALDPKLAGLMLGLELALDNRDPIEQSINAIGIGVMGPAAIPAVDVLKRAINEANPEIKGKEDGKTARDNAWEALKLIHPNRNERLELELAISNESDEGIYSIPLSEEDILEDIQALSDPNGDVRLQAAQLLGKIYANMPTISRDTSTIYIRNAIAYWEKALATLIQVLRDEDPSVRGMAALSLGQVGPAAQRAIPALAQTRVEDPEEIVRDMAKAALAGDEEIHKVRGIDPQGMLWTAAQQRAEEKLKNEAEKMVEDHVRLESLFLLEQLKEGSKREGELSTEERLALQNDFQVGRLSGVALLARSGAEVSKINATITKLNMMKGLIDTAEEEGDYETIAVLALFYLPEGVPVLDREQKRLIADYDMLRSRFFPQSSSLKQLLPRLISSERLSKITEELRARRERDTKDVLSALEKVDKNVLQTLVDLMIEKERQKELGREHDTKHFTQGEVGLQKLIDQFVDHLPDQLKGDDLHLSQLLQRTVKKEGISKILSERNQEANEIDRNVSKANYETLRVLAAVYDVTDMSGLNVEEQKLTDLFTTSLPGELREKAKRLGLNVLLRRTIDRKTISQGMDERLNSAIKKVIFDTIEKEELSTLRILRRTVIFLKANVESPFSGDDATLFQAFQSKVQSLLPPPANKFTLQKLLERADVKPGWIGSLVSSKENEIINDEIPRKIEELGQKEENLPTLRVLWHLLEDTRPRPSPLEKAFQQTLNKQISGISLQTLLMERRARKDSDTISLSITRLENQIIKREVSKRVESVKSSDLLTALRRTLDNPEGLVAGSPEEKLIQRFKFSLDPLIQELTVSELLRRGGVTSEALFAQDLMLRRNSLIQEKVPGIVAEEADLNTLKGLQTALQGPPKIPAEDSPLLQKLRERLPREMGVEQLPWRELLEIAEITNEELGEWIHTEKEALEDRVIGRMVPDKITQSTVPVLLGLIQTLRRPLPPLPEAESTSEVLEAKKKEIESEEDQVFRTGLHAVMQKYAIQTLLQRVGVTEERLLTIIRTGRELPDSYTEQKIIEFERQAREELELVGSFTLSDFETTLAKLKRRAGDVNYTGTPLTEAAVKKAELALQKEAILLDHAGPLTTVAVRETREKLEKRAREVNYVVPIGQRLIARAVRQAVERLRQEAVRVGHPFTSVDELTFAAVEETRKKREKRAREVNLAVIPGQFSNSVLNIAVNLLSERATRLGHPFTSVDELTYAAVQETYQKRAKRYKEVTGSLTVPSEPQFSLEIVNEGEQRLKRRAERVGHKFASVEELTSEAVSKTERDLEQRADLIGYKYRKGELSEAGVEQEEDLKFAQDLFRAADRETRRNYRTVLDLLKKTPREQSKSLIDDLIRRLTPPASPADSTRSEVRSSGEEIPGSLERARKKVTTHTLISNLTRMTLVQLLKQIEAAENPQSLANADHLQEVVSKFGTRDLKRIQEVLRETESKPVIEARIKALILEAAKELGSQDEGVQKAAARRVARAGEDAVEPLMTLLRTAEPRVKEGVSQALIMIGQPTVKPLILVLTDDETQTWASTTLTKMGLVALPDLVGSFNQKNPILQVRAAGAAGNMGSTAIPYLIETYQRNDQREIRIGIEMAIEQALTIRTEEFRKSVVETLLQAGRPVLPVLENILGNQLLDAEIRRITSELIEKIKGPSSGGEATERSEVRKQETLAQELLSPAVQVLAENLTGYLLPLYLMEVYGRLTFKAALKLLVGEEAFAAEGMIRPAVPALSQEEIASLGALHSALTSPSQTKRRVFDYRSFPAGPESLDPVLLYALHHREANYTLLLVGSPERVEAFRSELRKYSESRYGISLPSNFRIVTLPSVEAIAPTLQDLVSESNAPAGFVTEDERLASAMAYRRGLLRVAGSPDATIQNATALLTAERLLGELPIDFFIRVLTGEDLDLKDQWVELLASLRAREAFLRAA